jgi:hypothetical protein
MPDAILAAEVDSVESSESNDSWVPPSSKPKPRAKRIDFAGIIVEEKTFAWVPGSSRRSTDKKGREEASHEFIADSSHSNDVEATVETTEESSRLTENGYVVTFELESAIPRSPSDQGSHGKRNTDIDRENASKKDKPRSTDSDTPQRMHLFRLRCAVLCLLLLLVPGIVVSTLILIRDSDSTNSDPIDNNTSAPETPHPSFMPENDDLVKLLSSVLGDGGIALRDPSSPQFAAMQWIRTPNNDEIYNDQRFLQRYALATLYYSTGGDQWASSVSWLTNANECEWVSLSRPPICDAEGNIVEIDLTGNKLKGQLPQDLEILSNSLGKDPGIVLIGSQG